MTADTEFYWQGMRDHRLLIQHCTVCDELRHPPRPMCPTCNSLSWDAIESSGKGVVYSFVMPVYPPFPWFEGPYIVAVVELEEGTRVVTNLVGVTPEDTTIGMPVEVTFEHFDNDLVLAQFTPREIR
jgi:hypothetical protein